MKKGGTVLLMLSLLSVPLTSIATAQFMPGTRGGGWNASSPYQRMYNPKTVETIIGEVVGVDTIIPIMGMSRGVHLRVKTQTNEFSIHLGPTWYLNHQEVQFQPNDQVEVTGSRIVFTGELTMIAVEVRRGSAILKLRDSHGIPIWSGWRSQR
jgi:hypothetical protein